MPTDNGVWTHSPPRPSTTVHDAVTEQDINALQKLGFTRRIAKEFLEAENTIMLSLEKLEKEIAERLKLMETLNGELISKITKYLATRAATVTVTDYKGERTIHAARGTTGV